MRPKDKNAYITSKMRDFPRNPYLNHSICEKCGGKCCKAGGCGLMPCDVPEMSVEGIRKMLDTGKYSITFFCAATECGIIPIPIINAREVDSGKVNNSIIRKPCALQGEKGCELSDDERPTMGLLYIPIAKGDCRMLVSANDTLNEWFPYKAIMDEVVFEETGKSSEELFYSGCVQAAMEIRQKLDMGIEFTEAEMNAITILELTGTIMLLDE